MVCRPRLGAFEAMPGVQSAGLMAVWAPGQLGVLSPRLGGSHAREPGTAGPIYGSQVGLGYEWKLGERFGLGLAADGFGFDADGVTGYEDDEVGAGGATVQFNWYL